MYSIRSKLLFVFLSFLIGNAYAADTNKPGADIQSLKVFTVGPTGVPLALKSSFGEFYKAFQGDTYSWYSQDKNWILESNYKDKRTGKKHKVQVYFSSDKKVKGHMLAFRLLADGVNGSNNDIFQTVGFFDTVVQEAVRTKK